ncbi:hypothetical protein COY52_10115 [Candidatus Desantisbacteria bacterium CG_4_10_14_0_8_um_filter_48_22]|uniref:D-tyrosyl-tRNA(Tyr) deacylase n=1 Tax=Candidatus Desantisbacteria bacterium CG_4_10_14_0_8_um_filter_48_22 TaxID=1974543 RepID=A0A2M7S744_9BACT|nr:MAG: hypothetical protein AUJ67_07500 [Candidatus Desantisbacteria bacterium CG1_02_49_89]PIV55552.1 MAG: hypothetical protein COS16_06865 [Candidatus Desantisbacteria bacterium CG02_land_8_20_14_3_00_49_13]PIZ15290.1 MAG: hypothetical protein COY52_10115 [Candidatus Desantisbacteria bacterium CG_4_10_14_0_8_um_filter_48_22]PJB27511.1 MAG: hypothetical protein CO111_04980 [Candidatus Desantisbacteria bacterium CG_4_9_14_3_um_filter_50_7]
MRAVVQRVKWAKVSRISGEKSEPLGEIGKGMLIFLGIGKGDSASDAQYLADKLLNLNDGPVTFVIDSKQ